jgi:hypothetical protein
MNKKSDAKHNTNIKLLYCPQQTPDYPGVRKTSMVALANARASPLIMSMWLYQPDGWHKQNIYHKFFLAGVYKVVIFLC